MFFEDHVLIVVLVIIVICFQLIDNRKTDELTKTIKEMTGKVELHRTKLATHEVVLNSILKEK